MNPTNTNTQTVTRTKLDTLKSHPRQAVYFGKLPEQQIQRLAEDIKTNGLRHPVEILSDGTIVCGHQRVAAAKSLGWTEIDAIIRTDLEGRGEKAIEEALIGDNLNRRQLDPIEKARCIQRLRELHAAETALERKKRRASGGVREYKKCKFRDYLGKEFGMSGRTVDRYLAVLKTPRAIQDAVSQGKLVLTQAVKVAGLSEAVQTKLAAEIEAGGDAKKAVRKHLQKEAAPARTTTSRDTEDYVQGVLKSNEDLLAHVGNGGKLTQTQQRALLDSMKKVRGLPTTSRAGNAAGKSGRKEKDPAGTFPPPPATTPGMETPK